MVENINDSRVPCRGLRIFFTLVFRDPDSARDSHGCYIGDGPCNRDDLGDFLNDVAG